MFLKHYYNVLKGYFFNDVIQPLFMISRLFLVFLCSFCATVSAQNISLNDLQVACSKSNWEYANQYLLNKGWEYYGSDKGSTDEYNTITWSYNKSSYNDKATAWFYLYTYDGLPNKINYAVFNKEAYQKIQRSLNSLGYKLINNSIEDDAIINNYANKTYMLKITTEKRKKEDDYSSSDESFTAYRFLLIKKNSVYDPDNGKKKLFFENTDQIEIEYYLRDGKFEGEYKGYYKNGNLKMVGHYKNDRKIGVWKEYSDQGELSTSYAMLNGNLEGAVKLYDNGLLTNENNFTKDKLQGVGKTYHYDNDGILYGVEKFNYDDDKLHGRFEFVYVDKDKNERILSYKYYKNGIKEGVFQDFEGDSLILGSYENDKLNGSYKIFIDYNKRFDGGVIETDTTQLTIEARGYYLNDVKHGYWKEYGISGSLEAEGNYTNDKKSGLWKSYYLTFINRRTGELNEHSQELYLEENYKNGYKEGESKRYSYLESKPIDCKLIKSPSKSETDNCTYINYVKKTTISNYKKEKLHGDYLVKDSIGTIKFKGQYKDGVEDGFWLESYVINTDDEPINVFREGQYEEGYKFGKWIEYVNKANIFLEYHYKGNLLHGDYTVYNIDGLIKELKSFDSGKLKKLNVYDENGIITDEKYHILSETNSNIKVKYFSALSNGKTFEIDYLVTKPEKELSHHDFKEVFHAQLKDETKHYQNGLFLIRNQDGSTSIKGETYRNVKIGTWEYHYPKQNVKIITTYIDHSNNSDSEIYYTIDSDQLFDGDFIYTNRETDGSEERRIRDGLRNGNTIYFDKTGNKVKKEKYKDGILKE
ncbi:toxin-antitoxin system YwqK family antitoxin [Winogradskyella thalassocola]|uniref:Antitoxin component YwqK of the YwqJK toxin-antitoxin module n=1 Tax=Winogradskyella thalassocola TaxID=262004 RepID=A0A1G8B9K0_9FLAO|nr:hypothetical protein [Winogradskyella thalassocola]SDH29886.1 Antitoxin component YwqK of the YwqJK toxin-antitoxin module [Winogradskyella thalassocola]